MEERFRSDLLLMVEQRGRSQLDTEPCQFASRDVFVDGQVFIIESTRILQDAVARARLTEEPYFQKQPETWLARQFEKLRTLVLPPSDRREPTALTGLDPAQPTAIGS